MVDIENIKREYQEKAVLYGDFCKELVNQLSFLLEENNIQTGFPIEHRIKSSDSVLDKIQRNNLDIVSITEVNDFAGVRIICLFYKDLEKVEDLLKENLIIHKRENAINRLSDNTFGYGSIHFEASPKSEWLKIPTFKKHSKCKVEIQLRTAAQHIWAAVSHSLQYKKEADIPFELRRTINRAAALLETVDLEFERVQNERRKYFSSINSTKNNDILNIDTLKYVLDQNLPPENKSPSEDYSPLLNDVLVFGIDKMDKLDSLLKKHMVVLAKKNKELVESVNKRSTEQSNKLYYGYYHSGFVRNALREEFGQKADKYFEETYSSRK